MLARRDGKPAGVLTALRHPPLGVIGNVVVAPQHRGHGVATALMEAALARLADCRSVRVHAMAEAAGFYRRLGFTAEGVTSLWQRLPAAPPEPRTALASAADHWGGVAALDRAVYGGDRAALLRALREAVPAAARVSLDDSGAVDGFVLAKGEAEHYELGPWVVRRGCRGWRDLPAAALAALPAGARVGVPVPAGNERAARRLVELGFKVETSYIDMVRGEPWPDEADVCARAGGDKG